MFQNEELEGLLWEYLIQTHDENMEIGYRTIRKMITHVQTASWKPRSEKCFANDDELLVDHPGWSYTF